MTFLWIGLSVLAFIIAVLTLVDVFRRGGSVGGMVGWSALVIVLPFIGAVAYWATRRPGAAEVEQTRLAQDDVRRTAARRPM